MLTRKKGGDASLVNALYVLAGVVVVVTGISAAVFLSRRDLGSLSIKAHFARFGLEVEMKDTAAENKKSQKRN